MKWEYHDVTGVMQLKDAIKGNAKRLTAWWEPHGWRPCRSFLPQSMETSVCRGRVCGLDWEWQGIVNRGSWGGRGGKCLRNVGDTGKKKKKVEDPLKEFYQLTGDICSFNKTVEWVTLEPGLCISNNSAVKELFSMEKLTSCWLCTK